MSVCVYKVSKAKPKASLVCPTSCSTGLWLPVGHDRSIELRVIADQITFEWDEKKGVVEVEAEKVESEEQDESRIDWTERIW